MSAKPGDATNRVALGRRYRKLLKALAEDFGFEGKYPSYRRLTEDDQRFLSCSTEKYSKGLIVEVARALRGPVWSWQEFIKPEFYEQIEEDELTIAHLPYGARQSLSPHGSKDGIFRFPENESRCEGFLDALEASVRRALTRQDSWPLSGPPPEEDTDQ